LEHKEDRTTEYWINLELQQPEISSIGSRRKIKITIINDIQLTIVGLARTGHVGNYNCETTPVARFTVKRKYVFLPKIGGTSKNFVNFLFIFGTNNLFTKPK